MTIDSVWGAFSQGDDAARDKLLREHLNLVHHVARQLARTLSAAVEFDELVSCGVIGLMNALNSFQPSRGVAFSTFAVPRIRGAILDELRRQDIVPRSVRRRKREVARARESLTHRLLRQPTEREVAGTMSIDVDTLWRWRADHELFVEVSLDEGVGDDARDRGLTLESVTPDSSEAVDEVLHRQEHHAILREAIGELKEQERVVLTLYYFEELKLHEIAEILGVTESRVSQVRTKALARLRTQLASRQMAVA
jgi:RNA polymerase sigma factor FliA